MSLSSRRFLLAAILSAAALPAACGGNVVVDPAGSGGSGAGTTTTDTTYTTTTYTTTYTTTSGSSGTTSTGTSCDGQGYCGDSQSGCIGCALAVNCADELMACQNDPSGDCIAFVQCLDQCSNQACADQCAADHPSGATLYNDLVFCVICDECPMDCDGPGSGCP